MNKEVQPIILYSKIFQEDTFQIKKINSMLNLTPEQQDNVDINWKSFVEEANRKGTQPWEGTYYRLENIDQLKNDSKVLLFSTIKYSQIRGLTHNSDLSTLAKDSQPNHIATGSLIQTTDGYFIFGERNKNTMSNSNIDFIGGGLQPDELEVNSCADIFENMFKEMREETGIEKSHVSKIIGIGITLSSKYNVIFIFYTLLNIAKDEVLDIFRSHNDNEMNDLIFVEKAKLEEFLKDKGSYRPLVTELYLKNKANL